MLDFGDHVIGGGGHDRIEVAGGLAEDEVSPAVAFPGFDESEIAAQGAFKNEVATVEFAGFLAVGDNGAVAGGRVKRRDARAARTEAFRERTLRIQLHLQFAAEHELFEQLVLTNIGGDHLLHLAILQQQTNAEIVDAGVIADDGQVFGPFTAYGSDQILRNAAEAEAAHQNRHAIAQIGDSGVSGGDAFVHEAFWAKFTAVDGSWESALRGKTSLLVWTQCGEIGKFGARVAAIPMEEMKC